MSHLRYFYFQSRRLSTGRIFFRPTLGPDYKSKSLWEERLSCDLLSSDQNIIKTINTKILSGVDLNNLEVDVFINIAAPKEGETAQLCEAVKTLADFRKSLTAHTLLPSTSHAICRLFLDGDHLSSLLKLLEQRVNYGVFPDTFMMNILFDRALESENFAIASRLAALIMLQEEFGLNDLNDNFALYSVSKYIESKTNFDDWTDNTNAPDPILESETLEHLKANDDKNEEEDKAQKADEDEEEEEEDAEYIRIPFLRNPYNDKHFDLANPREICGKTLSMLGHHLSSQNLPKESELGLRCIFLGNILQANWSTARESLDKCLQSKVTPDRSFKEAVEFYLENLHQLKEPDAKIKESILLGLNKLPEGQSSISQEAELRHEKLKDLEQEAIDQLSRDIQQWSELRQTVKQAKDAFEVREKLIAEIKTKKDELKLREQYLYFYDDLRRNNLTRIEYD